MRLRIALSPPFVALIPHTSIVLVVFTAPENRRLINVCAVHCLFEPLRPSALHSAAQTIETRTIFGARAKVACALSNHGRSIEKRLHRVGVVMCFATFSVLTADESALLHTGVPYNLPKACGAHFSAPLFEQRPLRF